MERRLHLPPVRGVAAAGFRIVGTADLHHLAGGLILHHPDTRDEIGVAEPDLASRGQAVEFLGGILEKVLPFDIDHPREGDFPGSHVRVGGMVEGWQHFHPVFRVVLDDHAQGTQDRHHAGGAFVQVLPETVFQEGDVHGALPFGHADPFAEVPDRFRGVAAPSNTRQGRHPRVVPSGHVSALHQFQEHPLAHHRVGEVEAGELDLARREDPQVLDKPVVKRPVVLELQGAQGVGDPLDGVRLTVGEVIGGIDAPPVSGPVMGGLQYSIDHRVPQVQIVGGHVDPGPEDAGSVLELAPAHPGEQVQVFLHGPVPVGTLLSRRGQGPPVFPDLVRAQVTHVGLSVPDEPDGIFVQGLEIIRGVEFPVLPVEPEPPDVFLDGGHVRSLFPAGIGVIEPQVAQTAEFGGNPEIEADGLGMAEMQVAVGLGGEAGVNPSPVLARPDVFLYDVADKIRGPLGPGFRHDHAFPFIGSAGSPAIGRFGPWSPVRPWFSMKDNGIQI